MIDIGNVHAHAPLSVVADPGRVTEPWRQGATLIAVDLVELAGRAGRAAVDLGELVEDYPDDARGHSCLLLGRGGERSVHVVCAPKEDYVAIITAYIPSADEWEADLRTRSNK